MLLAVLGAALAAGLAGWPAPAAAQESSAYYRFYYSSWMQGRVEKSPLDPSGALTDERKLTQNIKAELEVILAGHFGLSFSRQKLHRGFRDEAGAIPACTAPPCSVEENAVQQSLNLTLYARAVEHDKFNLFLGGGTGSADYSYAVDGVDLSDPELHDGQSLARWFAGMEYSFERIGFRLEASTVRASKSFQGRDTELEETFQYFTVFIPLN
jgi:hypothetical protein